MSQVVKEAEELALRLQHKLRELYILCSDDSEDEEQVIRDAKMTMTGMMRGIHDFINYCKFGE